MKKLLLALGALVLTVGVVHATDLTNRQKKYIEVAIPEKTLAEEISDRLDGVDGIAESASAVIGEETSNTILVSWQFKDEAGADLTVPAVVECWLSDLDTGIDLATDAGTSAMTTSAGGVLIKEYTTGLSGLFVTDADGDLGVKLTQTAAITADYLACSTGVGKVVVSGAVDFN